MELKYHQIHPKEEIHGTDYSNGSFLDALLNSV